MSLLPIDRVPVHDDCGLFRSCKAVCQVSAMKGHGRDDTATVFGKGRETLASFNPRRRPNSRASNHAHLPDLKGIGHGDIGGQIGNINGKIKSLEGPKLAGGVCARSLGSVIDGKGDPSFSEASFSDKGNLSSKLGPPAPDDTASGEKQRSKSNYQTEPSSHPASSHLPPGTR
jgi:hypothetical protein